MSIEKPRTIEFQALALMIIEVPNQVPLHVSPGQNVTITVLKPTDYSLGDLYRKIGDILQTRHTGQDGR